MACWYSAIISGSVMRDYTESVDVLRIFRQYVTYLVHGGVFQAVTLLRILATNASAHMSRTLLASLLRLVRGSVDSLLQHVFRYVAEAERRCGRVDGVVKVDLSSWQLAEPTDVLSSNVPQCFVDLGGATCPDHILSRDLADVDAGDVGTGELSFVSDSFESSR